MVVETNQPRHQPAYNVINSQKQTSIVTKARQAKIDWYIVNGISAITCFVRIDIRRRHV